MRAADRLSGQFAQGSYRADPADHKPGSHLTEEIKIFTSVPEQNGAESCVSLLGGSPNGFSAEWPSGISGRPFVFWARPTDLEGSERRKFKTAWAEVMMMSIISGHGVS